MADAEETQLDIELPKPTASEVKQQWREARKAGDDELAAELYELLKTLI